MANSRSKGKRGELEAAAKLREVFGRPVRRSQQYHGADGDADLVGLPGLHPEVKRTERLRLWEALEQAEADSPDGSTALVLHRASRRPWVVIVRLDSLKQFADACASLWASEEE